MHIQNSFCDAVGNTPLIRLAKASELTGCEILGKAEFMNPGGSVKDRAAKFMLLDAQEKGLLERGGIVVEGTAGNTGIGLSLAGNSFGYKTIIVIPETQSVEKRDALRLCGAQLHEVPAVPFKNPENFVRVAERIGAELASSAEHGALYANQWDNLANMRGHYHSTGPEIWDQTEGKVDGFVCAIGTGGTLAGTGRFLKEKNRDVLIAAADPSGAAMFNWFKHGKLESEGSSVTEGIGQGRVTGNIAEIKLDEIFQIPDEELLPWVFDLLSEEGLCLGGSSGINVAGAVRLARILGPGHTIVTILCDSGTRYQSKLFDPEFLKSKNLPFPDWL
jgi:cysteine synthase A